MSTQHEKDRGTQEHDLKRVAWRPDELGGFALGHLTLGELEGITKERQYELANTGHRLLVAGKLQSARRIFEGLHALDPFDAYFLTALGSIAQREEKLEEADARYTRALEINPYSIAARAHRGEIRVRLGQLASAVEDLVFAATHGAPSDPAARRARAMAAALEGKLREHATPAGT